MKAEDILTVDFSKYNILLLDKVVITIDKNTKITTKEDDVDDIVITGFVNDKYSFSSFYNKEDNVRIRKVSEKCLVIARKEGGRDETSQANRFHL